MLGSCGKASKEEKCQEGCLIEHFYSSLNHVCYELTYPLQQNRPHPVPVESLPPAWATVIARLVKVLRKIWLVLCSVFSWCRINFYRRSGSTSLGAFWLLKKNDSSANPETQVLTFCAFHWFTEATLKLRNIMKRYYSLKTVVLKCKCSEVQEGRIKKWPNKMREQKLQTFLCQQEKWLVCCFILFMRYGSPMRRLV